MSTTIDEKVLEMRFDNRQFESNVSTTMSTLDKLKQKLNFTGASKGLENVNAAAKSVNMTGLGNAVETVSAKFSALQVMGVTALANITNSAVNAGKKIVKSLTIDPIKSGFEEYETKMGSIQTILANTEHQGTTLDDVTEALEKLNLYADKTIYNFQQMTKNIGTFTAAGVNLDTSVKSIQGIANLAAVSGSTSQQASTAMYQLSQALASGTVKLMDWNSVVNAGMGGKVFQNALIRTAAVMAGASDDVAAWQKKNIDAFGSFRDSLTTSGWLTTDVLTKTLEQFTMAAEEGSEEWEKFKQSLMSEGYTEAQAAEILKMANTATDAATKVKTFTQLMDTLKESAQSGWAQTWELMIGDFEEAKEFFTGLSDLFGGIIGESSNRRNNFLSDVLDSNWDKLVKTLSEAGVKSSEFEESIRNIVGDTELDKLITECGTLEKAIREGAISSDILKKALAGVAGTNAEEKLSGIVDGLEAIGRTLKKGHVGEDVKELQEALDGLGYDLGEKGVDGIIGPFTEKAITAFQEANGLIADGIAGPQTLEALEKAGAKVEETAKDVDGLKGSCDDLIDVITEKSGRELILDSIMNVIKAIQRPLAAVGEAFRDVFSISPDRLYNALEKINSFTEKLVPEGILDVKTWLRLTLGVSKLGIKYDDFVDSLEGSLKDHGIDVDKLIEQYGDLGKAFEEGAISFDIIKEVLLGFDGVTETLLASGETGEKVRRTFEGLFAVFEIIATIAAGPIKIAFNLITKVLGKLGLTLLDVTAGIGDSLVSLRDNITKVVDAVTDFVATNVAEWVKKLEESEIIKTVGEWFKSARDTISDAIDDISRKFSEFDTSSFMSGARAFGGFLSSIASGLAKSDVFIFIVDTVCATFERLKNFFTSFKLPDLSLDNLRIFSGLGSALEGAKGIGGAFTALGTWLKDRTVLKAKNAINGIFDVAYWDNFKAMAVEKFVSFWTATGDKLKAAFAKCKEVLKTIGEFLFGAEEINLPVILDVAQKFLGLVVLIKTIQLLNTLSSPLDNVTDAIDNLAKKLKWEAIGAAFKSMALALGTLTVCIIVLANMPDPGSAAKAAGILAGLLIVMGGIIAGLMALSTKFKTKDALDIVSVALSLGLLIGAIYLLTLTLEKIDSMHLVDPFETFVALGAMLAGLAAGIGIVALAGSSSFKSVAAILTLVAALNMMLDVIDKYDTHDWAGQGDAVLRMAGILLILSTAINIASRGVKGTAGAAGLATLLLAMVFSLKILLDVMEDFAAMDTGTLLKGGFAVVTLLGVLAWMMIEIGNANQGKVLEKGQKSVNNFVGLATALLAVVAAVWLLGKMATKDTDTFISGALAVTAILTGFTFMISKIAKSCAGLKMGVVIAALIGMGLIIAEVAIILKALEGIPWQQSLGTAAALGVVLLAMAGCLKTLGKQTVDAGAITTWLLALSALTVLVMFLAVILKDMETVTAMNAVGNATALGVLLLAMAGCLKILNASGPVDTKQIYTWVGVLATMSVVLLLLSVVLSIINTIEPGRALQNVGALVLLLAGMSAVLAVLSFVPVGFKNIMTWVVALGGLAIVIDILAGVLMAMDSIDSAGAISNATALGNLAIALSVAMVPITILGKLCGGASMMKGVGSLAALFTALYLVVAALAMMDGLSNARENAITLGGLALVLSVCMVALEVAGLSAYGALIGVGTLAILIVELFVVVGVLATMEGLTNARSNAETLALLISSMSIALMALATISILVYPALVAAVSLGVLMEKLVIVAIALAIMDGLQNAKTNADVLTDLLLTLSGIIILVGSIGANALIAVAALNGLVILVTQLGKLAVAVGILSDLMNGKLESFTDKGLDLLIRLARGLGEMIGQFGVGLSSGLPEIATNLSKFAFNLLPFIVTMNMVKDNIVDRAKNLAGAIIGLGIAELVSNFVPGELSSLGSELSSFASNMGGFAIAMSAFKPETVTAVESLCSAINALSEANLTTVFADFFDGLLNGGSGNSLGDFGEQMSTFATCIKDSATALKDISQDDVDHITLAADAGKAMATLNDAIPGSGGKWQEWAGEKNLATWGETLTAFGDCLVAFNEKVTGEDFDTDAITASANAAKALADVSAAIPSSGGVWQEWAGEKNLATWGETLVAFGDCLVAYNEKVTGNDFDTDAITNSATAASALTEVANALPESDGKWQEWAGEKNLGTFGQQLAAFAEGLVAYCTAASGIDQAALDKIDFSKQAVTKLKEVVALLPTDGGWWNSITGSADGQSFGDGIKSLAVGITTYCGMAKTIDDAALATIDKSKEAVTKLKAIIEEEIPGVGNSTNVEYLRLAVEDFSSIAATIGALTAAAYDYSGIEGLKTAISKVVGMVGEDGIDASSVETSFLSLWDGIGVVTQCAGELASLNEYSYSGIDNLKTAIETLKSVSLEGIAGAFSGGGDIVAMMTSMVDNMASGISNNSGKVIRAMGLLASDAISALEEYIGDFKDVSTEYVLKFASNMKNLKSNVKTAGVELGAEAVAGASSKVVAMTTAGNDLGAGLVLGIDAKWLAVYNAGYRLGQAAVQGEKDGQASSSPSKLTIQAGKWLGEGLVIGMERMGKSVYNAGADLGRTATSTVSGTISKIAAAINTDIDSQPTIRPVLDLSDVRAGAAGIGELFDTTSQVGVMANVGTVSTMMRGYGQNGGNSDIISAIDKLRKDLGNISGDTYSVGNVTYDDGSNIADAVKTITRVARMERRI